MVFEFRDDSPLIREKTRNYLVKGITTKQIRRIVHDLYLRAGLIKPSGGTPAELRPHSIRKYFKNQMIALACKSPTSTILWAYQIHTMASKSRHRQTPRSLASYQLTVRRKTQHNKLDTIREII